MNIKAVVFVAIINALVASSFSGTLVVPGSNATTEGDSGNILPFGSGGSVRYQQVYASTAFASLTLGGEYITQIAFRPDAAQGAFTSTQTVQLNLSTTSKSPDSLSLTFSANVGLDDAVVFGSAPLTLSSSATGGAPHDFDIIITLTTPFFYNPSAGNLLLDVRKFSGQGVGVFDAAMATTDAVSRVGAVNVTADSATFNDTGGLVTRFTTTVPEPCSAMLLLTGIALFATRRQRTGA